MTKLEGIRQKKKKFSSFFRSFDMNEISFVEQTNLGGVKEMKNKNNEKQNDVQPKKLEEEKVGYGDKKLEGPDRPSE